MFKKIVNIIKKNLLLFNIQYLSFLFSLRKIKKKNNSNNKIILADHFEVLENLFYRSLVLTELSNYKNAKVQVFNLKYNLPYYLTYHFLEFVPMKTNLNDIQKKEVNLLFKQYKRQVKNKIELFKFSINNVNIGWDIFESYLIRNFKPEVNLKDLKLRKIVIEALKLYVFWRDYLVENKISALFLSHRMYVETNILNRLAIKKKIPVYTISGDGSSLMKITTLKLNYFETYKKIFNRLSKNDKNNFISIAKNDINRKLLGEVGINMKYSKKSAFSNYQFKRNPIKKSKKINILICTHCFFDNPFAYGSGNLFLDFYEWLSFLAKISHKKNYNWFIKPHPDYLPGTIEIIKEISKKFKKIKIINPKASFKQITENLDYGLTVYGSIAHELPLLGVKVINASLDNPHKAFNFSITPNNLSEYTKILNNLTKVKKKNTNTKSIYEFYYMHNYFFKDKLFENLNKEKFYNNSKDLTYFNNYINNKHYVKDKKIIKKFFNSKKKKLISNKKFSNLFERFSRI
jgi:hypothetical protein